MYLSSLLQILLFTYLIRPTTSSETACITTNSSQCPALLVPSHDQNSSRACVCADHDQRIKCDQAKGTAQVSAGICATYNESQNSTVTGFCPYRYIKYALHYLQLPCDVTELNSFMCGSFNRTGQLCSQCMPGLGPAVLSNSPQCIECLDSRYGWLAFIALGFLGPTLLCILVIVFRINALSASMNMFLFTCHLISNYISLHRFNTRAIPGKSFAKPILSFYGLWNMEFFRYSLHPFCISDQLNSFEVQALEYVAAFCPLVVLATLFICIELHDDGFRPIVVIWRPFLKCCIRFRRSWKLRGSIINAFATFLLLSYSKTFSVSFSLLFPVSVKNSYGHRLQYVPLYDASTPYFSNNHKPFMILAIVMLTVFNLLPLLFLLLYPLKIVQRCLGRLPLRCVSFLNTFADAFQGCYKNGTGGTADCRCFAGLYLVFRVVLFSQSYLPNYFSMPLQVLTCVVIAMLFVTIRPYKAQFYTHFDAWSFIFVGIVYVYIWFETFSDNIHLPQMPVYIAYAIPAVYILTYCVLRLLSKMRCIKALVQKRNKQKMFENNQSEEDELPHRLEHPSEYSSLLPQASNPLPQETQEEATATAAAATNTLPTHSIQYGATT